MLRRWASLADLKTSGAYWRATRDQQSALEKSIMFWLLPVTVWKQQTENYGGIWLAY